MRYLRRLTAALVLASLAFAGTARAQYVALGDSFTSGEGAGDYLRGTDIKGNRCHRSPHAYPWAVAAGLGFTLSFHACSGAITPDFELSSRQYPLETTPQEDWLDASVRLITLTDGGNDVGFGSVVQVCVIKATLRVTRSCSDHIDVARSAVVGERAELVKLYSGLRRRAPAALVLVLAYPRLFPDDPPRHCNRGLGVSGFSRAQMLRANLLVDELDASIASAVAGVPGVLYVDVRRAFHGHTFCTPDAWVNAVHPLSLQETAHPKKQGQAAFAAAVLACYRDAVQCGPRP